MLGQHPDIAAGPESGLFTRDGGLGNLIIDYFGRPKKPSQYRLRAYVDETEFVALVHELAEKILIRHQERSGKSFLVEKTPAHAFAVPQIARLFPDARFVYLLRDGRDVVTSIIHAARSWMPNWPKHVHEAALMWKEYNEAVLSARSSLSSENLLLVRYEDLQSDTKKMLRTCFAFIGAQHLLESELDQLVAHHTIEQYQASSQDILVSFDHTNPKIAMAGVQAMTKTLAIFACGLMGFAPCCGWSFTMPWGSSTPRPCRWSIWACRRRRW